MLNTHDAANRSRHRLLERACRVEDVIPSVQSVRYPESTRTIPSQGHRATELAGTGTPKLLTNYAPETPHEVAVTAEHQDAVGRELEDEDLTVRSEGHAVVPGSREFLVRVSLDVSHPEILDDPPFLGSAPKTGGPVSHHHDPPDCVHLRHHTSVRVTTARGHQKREGRTKLRHDSPASDGTGPNEGLDGVREGQVSWSAVVLGHGTPFG